MTDAILTTTPDQPRGTLSSQLRVMAECVYDETPCAELGQRRPLWEEFLVMQEEAEALERAARAWELVVEHRLSIMPLIVDGWGVWHPPQPAILARHADPVQAVLDAVQEIESREADA